MREKNRSGAHTHGRQQEGGQIKSRGGWSEAGHASAAGPSGWDRVTNKIDAAARSGQKKNAQEGEGVGCVLCGMQVGPKDARGGGGRALHAGERRPVALSVRSNRRTAPAKVAQRKAIDEGDENTTQGCQADMPLHCRWCGGKREEGAVRVGGPAEAEGWAPQRPPAEKRRAAAWAAAGRAGNGGAGGGLLRTA